MMAICRIGNLAPQEQPDTWTEYYARLWHTGAEAIFTGTGFLSENEVWQTLCTVVGIKFIGPKSETIAKLETRPRPELPK